MNVWELTTDDVEAVVNLQRGGMSRQEVAKTLGMSMHMVVCAERKAVRAPRKLTTGMLGMR